MNTAEADRRERPNLAGEGTPPLRERRPSSDVVDVIGRGRRSFSDQNPSDGRSLHQHRAISANTPDRVARGRPRGEGVGPGARQLQRHLIADRRPEVEDQGHDGDEPDDDEQ